jgi:hypothetical protein
MNISDIVYGPPPRSIRLRWCRYRRLQGFGSPCPNDDGSAILFSVPHVPLGGFKVKIWGLIELPLELQLAFQLAKLEVKLEPKNPSWRSSRAQELDLTSDLTSNLMANFVSNFG